MRARFILGLAMLAGTVWGQIDTRLAPAPQPVVQQPDQSASKWTGAPLTGFLSETLGSTLKEGLETTFAVSESETNQTPAESFGNFGYDEVSRLTGTANFHQNWSTASLLMQYAAGTDIYAKNSYLNDQFHEFSAAEALRWARWNFRLNEKFNYLPQSQFGFDPSHTLGNGLLTDNGSAGPNLFLPPNVIERAASSEATAQYVLGARSSLSFSGSFSDLHFSGTTEETLLVDSEAVTTEGRYEYVLSGQNTIGAAYQFLQSRSIGFGGLMQSHSVTATYKRTLGKRLTLQAAVGPQFTTFNEHGTENTLGAATRVTASANYAIGRSNIGFSYFRGVNPGSGLFLGSRGNDVRASFDRQLSRTVRLWAAAGYADNKNLGTENVDLLQRIKSTYVSATIERDFGRTLSAFITYDMQNQDSNVGLCSAGGCISFPLSNTGIIGIRFHIHPLTMRP